MHKTQENETRIIAIGNPPAVLGKMFDGLIVSADGHVRVGSIDLHPKEIGPAVTKVVVAMNDFLESQSDQPLPVNRVILVCPEKEQKNQPSDLEQLGTWLYGSDNLGLRIQILELVVADMRNKPNLTERLQI